MRIIGDVYLYPSGNDMIVAVAALDVDGNPINSGTPQTFDVSVFQKFNSRYFNVGTNAYDEASEPGLIALTERGSTGIYSVTLTNGNTGYNLYDVHVDANGQLNGSPQIPTQVRRGTDNAALPGSEMNLVDDAITASKYDESTAFPVKSDDSGSTEIARTGADGDTLEALSDEIAAHDADIKNLIAALNNIAAVDVWNVLESAISTDSSIGLILKRGLAGTIHGKVNATPGSATVLTVKDLTNTDADLTQDDLLNNAALIFISGVLQGQRILISDFTGGASPWTLTVSTMVNFANLSADDEFIIV